MYIQLIFARGSPNPLPLDQQGGNEAPRNKNLNQNLAPKPQTPNFWGLGFMVRGL